MDDTPIPSPFGTDRLLLIVENPGSAKFSQVAMTEEQFAKVQELLASLGTFYRVDLDFADAEEFYGEDDIEDFKAQIGESGNEDDDA